VNVEIRAGKDSLYVLELNSSDATSCMCKQRAVYDDRKQKGKQAFLVPGLAIYGKEPDSHAERTRPFSTLHLSQGLHVKLSHLSRRCSSVWLALKNTTLRMITRNFSIFTYSFYLLSSFMHAVIWRGNAWVLALDSSYVRDVLEVTLAFCSRQRTVLEISFGFLRHVWSREGRHRRCIDIRFRVYFRRSHLSFRVCVGLQTIESSHNTPVLRMCKPRSAFRSWRSSARFLQKRLPPRDDCSAVNE